jgi:DNA-binding transcriptional LysR family regulator
VDINLDRLRAFIVVARTGNLTAAAKELGATQSNLGRQMTALEKEVGLTLFIRHSRGLALTKQGKEFLAVCCDIVGQVGQKIDIIKEKESSPSGHIKVISELGMLERILETLLKFFQMFPNINISFSSTRDITQLQIGDSDLALMVEHLNDREFIQLPLCEVNLRVYASPDYLKVYGKPKTLEELKSHRLIIYGGEDADIFNGQLPHELIKNSQQFVVVTNSSSMNTALINGLGVGCSAYNKNSIEKGLLIDIFPDMPDGIIPYYFTYHRRLEGSPKIRILYDFLVEEVVNIWQRPDKQ